MSHIHTERQIPRDPDCGPCSLLDELDRLEARNAGLSAEIERLKIEAAELRDLYGNAVLADMIGRY